MSKEEIRTVEDTIRDMYKEYINGLLLDMNNVKEERKHDAEIHNRAIHQVLDLLCME